MLLLTHYHPNTLRAGHPFPAGDPIHVFSIQNSNHDSSKAVSKRPPPLGWAPQKAQKPGEQNLKITKLHTATYEPTIRILLNILLVEHCFRTCVTMATELFFQMALCVWTDACVARAVPTQTKTARSAPPSAFLATRSERRTSGRIFRF